MRPSNRGEDPADASRLPEYVGPARRLAFHYLQTSPLLSNQQSVFSIRHIQRTGASQVIQQFSQN